MSRSNASRIPSELSSFENRELIQFGPFLKLKTLDTGMYLDSGTGPRAHHVCFYLSLTMAILKLTLSDKRLKDNNNIDTGNRCFAEYMIPFMTEWKTLADEVLQLAALTTVDREAILTVVTPNIEVDVSVLQLVREWPSSMRHLCINVLVIAWADEAERVANPPGMYKKKASQILRYYQISEANKVGGYKKLPQVFIGFKNGHFFNLLNQGRRDVEDQGFQVGAIACGVESDTSYFRDGADLTQVAPAPPQGAPAPPQEAPAPPQEENPIPGVPDQCRCGRGVSRRCMMTHLAHKHAYGSASYYSAAIMNAHEDGEEWEDCPLCFTVCRGKKGIQTHNSSKHPEIKETMVTSLRENLTNGIALEYSERREGERERDSQRQAALATINSAFMGAVRWRRGDRQRANAANARIESEARGGSSLRDQGRGQGRAGLDRESRDRGYEANTEERSRPTESRGPAVRGRGQGRGCPDRGGSGRGRGSESNGRAERERVYSGESDPESRGPAVRGRGQGRGGPGRGGSGRGRGSESNVRAERERVYRGESDPEESDRGEEEQFLTGAQRVTNLLVNEAAAAIEEEPVRIRLLSDFNNGLHHVHPKWKGSLKGVTTELLTSQTQAPDEKAELVYIMALLLLPGMVEYSRHSKGKGNIIKPGPFLAAVASAECPALCIINQAMSWQENIARRRTTRDKLSASQHVAKVTIFLTQNRGKAAMNAVDMLGNHLDGKEDAPPLSDEEYLEKVLKLYPRSGPLDAMPDASEDPTPDECLQVTPTEVRRSIYGLSTNSGAGNSGWTNMAIACIGDDRRSRAYDENTTQPDTTHIGLAFLFNKLLRGEVGPRARDLLTMSRLILIPKEVVQSGEAAIASYYKYRPLSVGDALMRLFERIVCTKAGIELVPLLSDLQFGGGVKDGAVLWAKTLDACHALGLNVMSVDVENAHNSVPRGVCYQSLKDYKQEGLMRVFRMLYGTPAVVVDNRGEVVARPQTGLRQGMPLSGLFFRLALQMILIWLRMRIRELEEIYNRRHSVVVTPGKAGGYEDDCSIAAHPEILEILANEVGPAFKRLAGLNIVVEKTTYLGQMADIQDVPEGIEGRQEGMIALGIPLGSDDYRKRMIREKITAFFPHARALALLPLRALMIILKWTSTKPTYICRSARNLKDVVEIANEFDEEIASCVATALQHPRTPEFQARIFLPQSGGGGIGMQKQGGMPLEKGIITSRVVWNESIHSTGLRHLGPHPNHLDDVVLGRTEDIEDYTELTPEVLASLTAVNVKTIMKGALKKATLKACRTAIGVLAMKGQYQMAAYHTSYCGHGGPLSIINSMVGIGQPSFFPDDELRLVLRLICGLPILNSLEGKLARRCPCGQPVNHFLEPTHGGVCKCCQGVKTQVSNRTCDAVYGALKQAHPDGERMGQLAPESGSVVGCSVTPQPGGGPPRIVECRADWMIAVTAQKRWGDNVIVCPGAKEFLSKGSALIPDRANCIAQDRKFEHYAKIVLPQALPPNSIIPFAIEMTGRLGPLAYAFVNSIFKTQTYFKSKLIKTIAMICARGMGKMLKATRDSYLLSSSQNGW
jgi:hypothetical protein